MHDDERELHRRFEALRRDDARGAPSFQRLWAARRGTARGRRGRDVWRLAALAAAALVVAISLVTRPPTAPPPPRPAITLLEWRSPTAFLLETPGREVLAAVPRLGAPTPPPPRLHDEMTKGEPS